MSDTPWPTRTAPLQPIGFAYEIRTGKMLQREQQTPTDEFVPYLKAVHVQRDRLQLEDVPLMWASTTDARLYGVDKGDLLVCEGGQVGRSAFVNEAVDPRTVIEKSLHRLRPRGVNSLRYLHYSLAALEAAGWFDVLCKNATLSHLTGEKLAAIRIPLPAPTPQRAIADYLDRETARIDAVVEARNRLMAQVWARRDSAADAMFRKAAGCSELVPLWRLIQPVDDVNHPDDPVLSIYRDLGVILKESRSDNYNKTPEDLTKYQRVNVGDVVVNKMKAWQGSIAVSEHAGIISPDYLVCRPRSRGVDASYLHAILRSPQLRAEYSRWSEGIRPAQWRLQWDKLRGIRIPVPDARTQRALARECQTEVSVSEALVEAIARGVAALAERRSALITAAVTGQIDVTEEAA